MPSAAAATTSPERLAPGLFLRLATMMALQWGVWVWSPFLGMFLLDAKEFSFSEMAAIFNVAAVGMLLAPFIAGQFVDRYMATEKYLGFAHLAGAVVIWQLSWVEPFWAFLIISLLYSLLFGPTTALTNSLALRHVPDADRHFGAVRVCGIFGFIPATIILGHWLAYAHAPAPDEIVDLLVAEQRVEESARGTLLAERNVRRGDRVLQGQLVSETDSQIVLETDQGPQTFSKADVTVWGSNRIKKRREKQIAIGIADAFKLSALLGVIMGLFCFTLPHTPPSHGAEKYAFIEAWKYIKKQPLVTLFLVALPLGCVHKLYFVHTGRFVETFEFQTPLIDKIFGLGGGGMMTLGQMCEAVVMVTIGFYVAKVSRKLLLALGILAYVVRFGLFAYAHQIEQLVGLPASASVIIGLLLHGFGFTWFWFLGYLIVDEKTPTDVRGSAQSLYNLLLFGFGAIAGSWLAAFVGERAQIAGEGDLLELDYTTLFAWPFWISLSCLLALLLSYPHQRPGEIAAETASETASETGADGQTA